MSTVSKRRDLGHDPVLLTLCREQIGMSQAEVARQAKIPQGSLSQMEAGKRNSTDEIRTRLAAVLKCPKAMFLARPVSLASRAPNQ